MELTKLRRLGYAWLLANGVLALLAPRLGAKLKTTGWRCAFDGVGDLTPKPWYVRFTRALGGGLVATGLLGLLQETRAAEDGDLGDDSETGSEPEPEPEAA